MEKLKFQVYVLWFQHSEWTKMAFTSIIFDNPDKDEVLERLLRNPMDFQQLLSKYYGDRIAYHFCALLTEHLRLAGDLVVANMEGDLEKAQRIKERLYKNAEEIADFLASINKYWSYIEWKAMFFRHLDLAISIADNMIKGNYRESIKIYDKFEKEVFMMADMMIEGMIKQFYKYRR